MKKNTSVIKRLKSMDKCIWFSYQGVRQRRIKGHHIEHRIRYQKPFLIPIWNPNGDPKEFFIAFNNQKR